MASHNSPSKESVPNLFAPRLPDRLMSERETAKAYQAFTVFFQMGAARSIPELVKKVNLSLNSLYKWAKQFRWDERIDQATAEIATIYRRETEKQAEIFAARNAHKRQEIANKEFELIELAHAKAKEVLQFVVVKDVTASADGKTIIIKSNPNIRLGDAMRLLIAGNVALNQAHQILNPRKGSEKTNGLQVAAPDELNSPVIEIWLDGGDGTPLPLSQMPEPDKLDPDFHPDRD